MRTKKPTSTGARHRRDPYSGGVLSLTRLEHMSEEQKTARVKAVANDMAASIIYIAKQAEAGNLTAEQTTPLYNLFADITTTERAERERMTRSLEKTESRIERMKCQHRRDIDELMRAAASELKMLKKDMRRIETDVGTYVPTKEDGPRDQQSGDDAMDMDTSADSTEEVGPSTSQDDTE